MRKEKETGVLVQSPKSSVSVVLLIVVAFTGIGLAIILSDGRYILDILNRYCFPKGPAIVTSSEHIEWRNKTRQHVDMIATELHEWESSGNSFPEFTSLTPPQYFPEADKETYGKTQKRSWGFLWLRLYGLDTKLISEFPYLVSLYDDLPDVEVISIGISKLDPGRGDVTHYGEFRGTWRQLLTIEDPVPSKSIRLGLYPYSTKDPYLCDSIWTSPDIFQTNCLQENKMDQPRIHEYTKGKDILFDDSVWHFIDNDSIDGRRVAIWIDVVRTDLNWVQKHVILRIFLFAAKYLNPEVTDMITIVNDLNYKNLKEGKTSSWNQQQQDEVLLNNAPKGPLERYNRSNLIDVDEGFF